MDVRLRPAGAAVLLALLALGPRLFVAGTVPLAIAQGETNCAPDEREHVDTVLAMSRGRLPTVAELRTAYPAYLPTVYAVQAGTWALGRAAGLARLGGFRGPARNAATPGFPLARLGSALLGVAFVLLAADAVARVTRPALGLFAGACLALWPQLVFVQGVVNGDAFTIAAGGLLAACLARWWRSGEGSAGLLGVGMAAGGVLLGKPNGYGLLVPAFAWVLLAAAERRISWRAAAGALAAAAWSLPVLAWNAARNGGDALGTRALAQYLAVHPENQPGSALPGAMASFPGLLASSSFAVFGSMSVRIAPAFYAAAALLVVAGAGFATARLRAASWRARRPAAFVAVAAAVQIALCVHMSWAVDFQPQGRYAMPGVLFLVTACLLGPVLGEEPERAALRRAWMALVLAFLSVAAGASLWRIAAGPCV